MARPKQNPHTDVELRLAELCQDPQVGSVEKLAAAIGREPSAIRKWGQRNSIPKDGAKAISSKFRYSLEWLLTGNGKKLDPADDAGADLYDEETIKLAFAQVEAYLSDHPRNTPLATDRKTELILAVCRIVRTKAVVEPEVMEQLVRMAS